MKTWMRNLLVMAVIAMTGFGCCSPRMQAATPSAPVIEPVADPEPETRVITRRRTTVTAPTPLVAPDEAFHEVTETP